jgi:hypothetical protein
VWSGAGRRNVWSGGGSAAELVVTHEEKRGGSDVRTAFVLRGKLRTPQRSRGKLEVQVKGSEGVIRRDTRV